MTELEAKKLLLILEGSYPTMKFTSTMIQAYTANLIDLPYSLATMSVRDLVRTMRFPPTPAEIREQCVLIAHPLPSVDDALAEVRNKARNFSLYSYTERNTYSSELIRDALRSVGGLEKLAYSERPEILHREFKEAYKRIRTAHIQELQRQDNVGLPPGTFEGETPTVPGERVRLIAGGGVS